MFSRTSLDKLLNKIDCSNVLRDTKTEADCYVTAYRNVELGV